MVNNGYFDLPFAVNGNVTTIPDATQPDGTVSYNQGFPVGYSTPVASGGLLVPRTAINQVLYDITVAIQQYQQHSTAPFITTVMNGGTPYSYSKYDRVLKSGVVYQSLVNTNTDTPPSAKWVVSDVAAISSTQAITGTNHTYVAADSNLMNLRSNSGGAMVDTLPGTSPGVMAAGWKAEIVNNDASGLLYLSTGSGANLNGSSTGSILLGPNQRCVIFSDGSNYWAEQMPGRTRLGANTSLFVATTGNDANNGIVVGSPYLTIQRAINVLANNVDLNGFTATVVVADGTYTGTILVGGGFVGNGIVQLQGNNTTPANCLLNVTGSALAASYGAVIYAKGFKTAATVFGIVAQQGGSIIINGNWDFGACAVQVAATDSGSYVLLANNYNITAGASFHIQATGGGEAYIPGGTTITLTGTPAFATSFVDIETAGILIINTTTTYTGSATGKRYNASTNGVIYTNGQATTFLPGSIVGTTATGGQYA